VAHDPSLWRSLCVLREVRNYTPDMRPHHPTLPGRILTILAGVLILKAIISIIINYQNYFPPDFTSDFLRGRERHFLGIYQWAFYTHIMSGPVSLLLGLILISERSRTRFPQWHRYLGRLQVACVVLLVTPSGLWMAYHAAAGPIGAVGLAALAIATAICVSLGARSAVMRRFADHRRWMWRCYLLLCSAVVLRLIGGLATVAGPAAPWVDPLATWMSWLVPLAAFELRERTRRRSGSLEPDRPRARSAQRRRDTSVH
jgi:small-conductance mechanosensitive channel